MDRLINELMTSPTLDHRDRYMIYINKSFVTEWTNAPDCRNDPGLGTQCDKTV